MDLHSKLFLLSLRTPYKLTFVPNILGTNKFLFAIFLHEQKNEKMVDDNNVLYFQPSLFIRLYLFFV